MAAPRGMRGMGEKIKMMFRSAAADYKAAAKDTYESMKQKPLKSSIYTGLILLGIQLNRTVPNEKDFYSKIVEKADNMVLLSDKVRNKNSDDHIQRIADNFAKGRIRYQNLAFFSIIYFSEYDKDNKYYESQCKYMQPSWRQFHERVIDIGCYRRWWLLRYKTTDYDVNFSELPKDLDSTFAKLRDHFKRLFEVSYFGNPAVPMAEQKKVRKAIEVNE